jgi:hypothetical protein
MTPDAMYEVAVVASEAAGKSGAPAWIFGVVSFGILMGLLVVTLMIKVDR